MEVWRKVDFLPSHFEISNKGRIKNTKTNNILKGWKNPKGYLVISICVNNKTTTHLKHRLVAKAFIPNPNNYDQVNHINGNKLDNTVSNLEWCNNTHNITEAYKNNLITTNRLSSEQRDSIVYKRDVLNMKFIEIAKELGINESSVRGNYYRRKRK